MKRVLDGVTRLAAIAVEVDGVRIPAYPGETVAVALLGSGARRFREDRAGAPRGMFCNMGTCAECTVWIAHADGTWRRQRGCLVPVAPDMRVRTHAPENA